MNRLGYLITLIATLAVFGVPVVKAQVSARPPALPPIHVSLRPLGDVRASAYPISLPAAFVAATKTLFDDGLADPRGGTYRAVTLRYGAVWGEDGGQITTHAWVMPASRDGVKRAVAWNGLSYTVIAETGPANLEADVASVVKERGGPDTKPINPIFHNRISEMPNSEAYDLDVNAPVPIQASLLLRLGETKLATRVYAASLKAIPMNTYPTDFDRRDPFVRMAGDWAWSAFDRAICAHMRGDDRLALDDATLLSVVGPKIEAQAKAHGAPLPDRRETRYFGFLAPVPALLADSRRRLASPEPRLDFSGTRAGRAGASERITLLIQHLDEVTTRQNSQPGGVDLSCDPICAMVIAEGDNAVDPLFAVIQSDRRLTRSVGFWRDFYRSRGLYGVRDAAAACITRILHIEPFDVNDATQLNKVHAYWKANHGLPIAERWYRTLADDKASPNKWLEAAENIVRPVGVNPAARVGLVEPTPAPGTPGAVLSGEALRFGKNPSVSALLTRRVAQIVGPNGVPNIFNADFSVGPGRGGDGMAMGLAFAKWDRKAALPTLQLLIRSVQRVPAATYIIGTIDRLPIQVARLTVARVQAGDSQAASDYSALLGVIHLENNIDNATEAFSPLYTFPHEPALIRAAERLFDRKDFPWDSSLCSTLLLRIPAFRQHILRKFQNHNISGTATITREAQVEWTQSGAGNGVYGTVDMKGPLAAPVGTPFKLRVCDMYAWYAADITRAEDNDRQPLGMPGFELYWPQSQRDRAIAALTTYLLQHGDRL